jgi:predicted nucleic-acid-binding protein
MVDILYDMSLISVSKGINKRILENNGMKPKSYILKKYNIDSLQFVKSNEFYANDLEKYLNIYERVLEKLEFNREVIIDSIEEYKKNRANRSKQIISEEQKNNRLIKKPKKPFRSEILKN